MCNQKWKIKKKTVITSTFTWREERGGVDASIILQTVFFNLLYYSTRATSALKNLYFLSIMNWALRVAPNRWAEREYPSWNIYLIQVVFSGEAVGDWGEHVMKAGGNYTTGKAVPFKTVETPEAMKRKCDSHACTHTVTHTHLCTHTQWRQGVTESVWRLFNEGNCVLRLRRLALLTSLSCLSR